MISRFCIAGPAAVLVDQRMKVLVLNKRDEGSKTQSMSPSGPADVLDQQEKLHIVLSSPYTSKK